MNFIAQETPQKLRGGFYTDRILAAFLTDWVLESKPARVLEPSCGDGVFLEALVERAQRSTLREVLAWEIDPVEAEKARHKVSGQCGCSVTVEAGDFLRWHVFHREDGPAVDGVLGNPPFIRYQYLPEEQQFLAEKISSGLGLPFTKHTNAWVPFVIAALARLTPGGRLGMVVPSEILHIPHARGLRQLLMERCARVLLIDPDELWFESTLQGVVLLLAEKKRSPGATSAGVAVERIVDRQGLRTPASAWFARAEFRTGPSLEGKWMRLFLSCRAHSLLEDLARSGNVSAFSDQATVDVGIVTGANEFFLVPDAVVQEFELQPWAHPMFGRSEHVPGMIYDGADHQSNRRAGLPANFLWFDNAGETDFPARVQEYLKRGVDEGLPKRFKCRVRRPWYRVPSVYTSPVALLKRAHHYPRLLLNQANAFTTDTAYRIQPKTTSACGLVYSFLNSATCLCAELEGRHYGGGVLELVPSEIERLLLPRFPATEEQLADLDRRFRTSPNAPDLLRAQDQIVLAHAGLGTGDRDVLHRAWESLRNRRQRRRNDSATNPAGCDDSPPEAESIEQSRPA